jgi:hypothetical protein
MTDSSLSNFSSGPLRIFPPRSVLRLKPNRDPAKPCVYVGMTGLAVQDRFQNHKKGQKSAWVVKRCGLRLMAEHIPRRNLMNQKANLIRADLKTPRAAAIAGIVFSVLMISGLLLIRLSVPANPLEAGTWLRTSSGTVAHTLYLVPFAGIAFLWFIGVLRDRLGEFEDRFFSTVFFGSGLLFLAMLFTSAALAGGIIVAYRARPVALLDSATYILARDVGYEIMNLYAGKMAAVFMISTCTLAIRTGFIARWIAFLGYALALFLLLSGRYVAWVIMAFPLWVLLVSIYILIDNLRRRREYH